jgi:anti-sigma factor RsiW
MSHLSDTEIESLLSGQLSPSDEDAIWAHIESCDTCLDRFERRTDQTVLSLQTGDEPQRSPLFHRRLMQRINREQTGQALAHFILVGFSGLASFIWQSVTSFTKKVH